MGAGFKARPPFPKEIKSHEQRHRFLDEPTTGIDVASARQLRQLIDDLQKPPNVSWGIIFPLAWTGMFFMRSGAGLDSIHALLPGVVAISILFGTTSMLAVTVTFEKKNRSFERLLLAPISLELLMLAKTGGAIFFGFVNALVPVVMAAFIVDLSQVVWSAFLPAVVLIAVVSTFLGLFIAVAVSEIFEAQTFSNFFRFPMIFLCGLFFPIAKLPIFLKPLSYVLPLTYGVDILRWGFE